MKKNVWILNHYASQGYVNHGGRHYCISKYLRRQGYKPTVFCCNKTHNAEGFCVDNSRLFTAKFDKDIGVPFVFIKGRDYESNGKERILNMVDFYFNVKKAAKIYAEKNGKPDVIYASSFHPLTLLAGIKLAKKFNVPCICEIRDLWPETLVAYGEAKKENPIVLVLRVLEKKIYLKCDALIFTIEGAYQYIVEQGWEKLISKDKVHYINNGVDLETFEYNKCHFAIEDLDLNDSNIFKVIYTGSIRRVNNLSKLLLVAKEIKNPSIKFLIWGNGNELEGLKKRVVDENITNVIFKGRIEKKYIPYILCHADLNYVHNAASPLFKYGISFNKVFEYLAAEKPIICAFPANHNPVITYNAGLDVNSSQPKDIAKAIERIVEMTDEEKSVFSENARYASKIYDFKNLTNTLIEVIENI